ncbi:MAG: multifunctional CCA addition/repair protein [Gammaproteobacteria bacterium]
MEIYLVGGAVRDRLLGLPVGERDYVVVGGSPHLMIENGFRPVGRDFPVFLHPETGEEYALARTERKKGRGYHGFSFETGTGVTLIDDLARRDLTINAIAENAQGELIDPHGGRADLAARILRHVSPAFVEDPLRVLRVARFAARFRDLGFTLAPETRILMTEIVRRGELDSLPPERIWQETRRAFSTTHPEVFFATLRTVGALGVLIPELDALFGIPQEAELHPEIDAGEHILLALAQSVRIDSDPVVGYAVLTHDLGKAKTPRAFWPQHPDHARSSALLSRTLSARLRVPNDYRITAELTAHWHLEVHTCLDQSIDQLAIWIGELPYRSRAGNLIQALKACEADFRGRPGYESRPYPQRPFLEQLFEALRSIRLEPAEYDWPLAEKKKQLNMRLYETIRKVRTHCASAS